MKNVVDGINAPPLSVGGYSVSNDYSFSSLHAGGANFAKCDGSTNFVNEDVDLNVYKASASRASGETEVIK